MSQISQAPPPISHSDHCHLSFNSNHLHLINTQSSQHYLCTHLSQLSDLAYTKWTHTYSTVTYLKITYLLFLVGPPCLLRLPVFVCHPSSSSVSTRGVCLPRHPRVPGKKTIISIYFNFLSTSRYLLTILPCLPDC